MQLLTCNWCADKLDAGLQRRLSVACQLVGAGPLLVLHDVLQGVHEGDALAIMRTIHERARCACRAQSDLSTWSSCSGSGWLLLTIRLCT